MSAGQAAMLGYSVAAIVLAWVTVFGAYRRYRVSALREELAGVGERLAGIDGAAAGGGRGGGEAAGGDDHVHPAVAGVHRAAGGLGAVM